MQIRPAFSLLVWSLLYWALLALSTSLAATENAGDMIKSLTRQYNRARYYDQNTGRWISQDPLGFDAGDSNLYRYVNNGPATVTDPSGSYEVYRSGPPNYRFMWEFKVEGGKKTDATGTVKEICNKGGLYTRAAGPAVYNPIKMSGISVTVSQTPSCQDVRQIYRKANGTQKEVARFEWLALISFLKLVRLVSARIVF